MHYNTRTIDEEHIAHIEYREAGWGVEEYDPIGDSSEVNGRRSPMSLSAEDVRDLTQLYTLSTRLISDGEMDRWVELFTTEGEFYIPPIEAFGAPATDLRGPEALRAYVGDIVAGKFDRQLGHPPESKKRYLVTNLALEAEGEGRAIGSAYLTILLLIPGQPPTVFGTGVYKDRFEKTGAGWKIARRVLEPDI